MHQATYDVQGISRRLSRKDAPPAAKVAARAELAALIASGDADRMSAHPATRDTLAHAIADELTAGASAGLIALETVSVGLRPSGRTGPTALELTLRYLHGTGSVGTAQIREYALDTMLRKVRDVITRATLKAHGAVA